MKTILIVGNTDGIGEQITKDLLASGNRVIGISRRDSSINHKNYSHSICDVTSAEYKLCLKRIITSIDALDVCIFCAGMGNFLNFDNLAAQTQTFEVNTMAAVVTTEIIVGHMVSKKHGHFIGLSSIADKLISQASPSYSASKAAISKYWEGLGFALLDHQVKITNVRFGFVDTKMAKSKFKPFLMTREKASRYLKNVIERPRIRMTKPFMMGILASIIGRLLQIKVLLH